MARWQLMHEYAQKSINTTLPRNDARSIGLPSGVLSHWVIALTAGAGPHCCSWAAPSVQSASWPLTAPPRFSLRWISLAEIPFCIAAV